MMCRRRVALFLFAYLAINVRLSTSDKDPGAEVNADDSLVKPPADEQQRQGDEQPLAVEQSRVVVEVVEQLQTDTHAQNAGEQDIATEPSGIVVERPQYDERLHLVDERSQAKEQILQGDLPASREWLSEDEQPLHHHVIEELQTEKSVPGGTDDGVENGNVDENIPTYDADLHPADLKSTVEEQEQKDKLMTDTDYFLKEPQVSSRIKATESTADEDTSIELDDGSSGDSVDESLVKFPDPFDYGSMDETKIDRIVRNRIGLNIMETTIFYKSDEFGQVRMEKYTQTKSGNRILLDYKEFIETHHERVTHKHVLDADPEVVQAESSPMQVIDRSMPFSDTVLDDEAVQDNENNDKISMTEDEKRGVFLFCFFYTLYIVLPICFKEKWYSTNIFCN